MRKFFLATLFQSVLLISSGQSFKIGDKVEAYNSGAWYKASIIQIGADNYKGYYSVRYDGYNQDQWIKATNIRALKSSSVNSDAEKNGPRNGKYIILSYGNPANPIRIGYFELNKGKYTYYDMSKKNLGGGSYIYDAKNKTVQWSSGPFKDAKWGGQFEIDREGKTHKLRLNQVTIGSNSTDSN